MPQKCFPFFPEGVTEINSRIAFQKENGKVTYFNWAIPIFIHDEDDNQTFKMITSQFCANGNTTQVEIARAFGIPLISVKRAVQRYRKGGPSSFYAKRKGRGPSVLTPQTLDEAQQMFDEGKEIREVAEGLGVKKDTLAKAIAKGKLHKIEKKESSTLTTSSAPTAKSQRNQEDSIALMGMGATDFVGRVLTSLGPLPSIDVKFKHSLDIPNGGVLLAIPSLLLNGLLRHAKRFFSLPKGFYRLDSIFVLLSFLALCRVRSIEQFRYKTPGEWGKTLGLDRAPEVKTLRDKIANLVEDDPKNAWSAELCKDWMHSSPSDASLLYVDGHVRVYHGKQTKLPRHYVAREKLCLRATTDYWVNAMDGQPFFFVNKPVDPGMIEVLKKDIVPRLISEVPNQPPPLELKADPHLKRFTIVFDREGYSPDLMYYMKQQNIACLTYHKFPGKDWCAEEFSPFIMELDSGDKVEMMLAERATSLGGKIWVREIRRLTKRGHQTSVIATDYTSDISMMAIRMFARWSQENFFKYMRQHFSIDSLINYQTEEIVDTTRVINPDWRTLDGRVRSKVAILSRLVAKFGAMALEEGQNNEGIEKAELEKANLFEEIKQMEIEVSTLKELRKNMAKHITISELKEQDRFKKLATASKHFIDTIKMIAYRAETDMVHSLRQEMSRYNDGRSLIRNIYTTDADIIPDENAKTLTVRLHHLANASEDRAASHLCRELTETKTKFPGSDLTMVFELNSPVSLKNRRGQEV